MENYEAILMSTHNICFYGELTRIILELSSNTLLICSTDFLWCQRYKRVWWNWNDIIISHDKNCADTQDNRTYSFAYIISQEKTVTSISVLKWKLDMRKLLLVFRKILVYNFLQFPAPSCRMLSFMSIFQNEDGVDKRYDIYIPSPLLKTWFC